MHFGFELDYIIETENETDSEMITAGNSAVADKPRDAFMQ